MIRRIASSRRDEWNFINPKVGNIDSFKNDNVKQVLKLKFVLLPIVTVFIWYFFETSHTRVIFLFWLNWLCNTLTMATSWQTRRVFQLMFSFSTGMFSFCNRGSLRFCHWRYNKIKKTYENEMVVIWTYYRACWRWLIVIRTRLDTIPFHDNILSYKCLTTTYCHIVDVNTRT